MTGDCKTREVRLLRRLLDRLPFPDTEVWDVGEHRQAAYALLSLDMNERMKHVPKCAEMQSTGEPGAPGAMATIPLGRDQPREGGDEPPDRDHTDVLLLTPLVKELLPGLHVLGRNPKLHEDLNLEGYRIFRVGLKQEHTDHELRLTITSSSAPRNVTAALDTSDFIRHFEPSEAVIMIGIGGGVKSKTDIGDVILAEHIIDVEGGRKESSGTQPRYDHFDIPRPIIMHASYYNPNCQRGSDRRVALLELASTLREAGFDVPGDDDIDKRNLRFERGHVVAGDKLIADGSLKEYLKTLDDRIRVCDMEGAGFARACDRRGVQYLLFRGVSDFGESDKNDEWQAAAAAFAMYDAMSFLQTQFRRKSEVGSLA